jgi:hypothetical protein
MEITKTNETTTTEANVIIGSIIYTFNYVSKDSKVLSLNGNAVIDSKNIATFNVYPSGITSNSNINFSADCTIDNKKLIVGDVDDIYTTISK